MKKNQFLTAMCICLSSSALAGTMGTAPINPSQFIIGLSLGSVWVDKNNTQTFMVEPGILKTYTANNVRKAAPFGELFVGYEKNIFPTISSAFGFAIGAIGKTKTKGFIYDDGDTRFTNESYFTSTSTTYLIAKARLSTIEPVLFNVLKPFVDVGIGAGYNRASDFTITAIDCGTVADPNFGNNTDWAFGYTVSAGLQTNLRENVDVSLAAVYGDFGNNHTNIAPGQISNQRFSSDTAYWGLALGFVAHI
jgi:opacity protein-like surface antigen